MSAAVAVSVGAGLLVILLGDLIRGTPKRIEGRLERLLRDIGDEGDRDRWREELQGVLLEFEGRPLKQLKVGRDVIRAAEELVEVYRPRAQKAFPAVGVKPPEDDEGPVAPASRWIDLRREFSKVAAEFLSYRELRVLELRYGLGDEAPHSIESVSRKFNVVPEGIEEIERQAILKLESVAEAQRLREVPPARR